MPEKLLILIHDHIPTTSIVIRSLQYLRPQYEEIKVVRLIDLNYQEFFSGEYKLLLIRVCSPVLVPYLNQIKKAKLKYTYYIDDNFWQLQGDSPVVKSYQHSHVQYILTELVSLADTVIASSDYLANYIRFRFNSNTIYLPASFDFSLIAFSSQKPAEQYIKILYAATYYRDRDFSLVTDALKQILSEFHGKVRLYFYGYIPDAFKGMPNVVMEKHFLPYDDYIKKQYIERFDIGIAPLVDSVSNRSKSNVKYREYGACSIAGIYTNIPPYSDCIIHEKNGLLVDHTTESWYQALKLLINNNELRQAIAKNAYEDVYENFNDKVTAFRWLPILNNLSYNKNIYVSVFVTIYSFCFRLSLIPYYSIKMINYLKYHGFFATLKKIRSVLLRSTS